MPAVPHLQPRFLESGGSSGISASAIGLLVAFGLIPCIVIIWVVIFLFFAYPYDRNWCCMKRKKHKDNIPELPVGRGATDWSEETLQEKSTHNLPKRPFVTHDRTNSGNSSNTGRLTKERSSQGASKYNARISLQSVGSVNAVQGVGPQEPKRFV